MSIQTVAPSPFRHVFATTPEMRNRFVQFLTTIFYRLDEKKVLFRMNCLVNDLSLSDEEIYTDLASHIGEMEKSFGAIRQLYSLRVLKRGMADQAKRLLTPFNPDAFHDYLEIYNRRYLDVLRSRAGLCLDGQTVAAADFPPDGTAASKLEAGALFSKFPYQKHVSLNDSECSNPSQHPEMTHKPIGPEVGDASLDLIACLGGLHHISEDRVEPFVDSLARVLRPGAVFLLRDHDAADPDVHAIASVVHSFVNAAAGVPWNVEAQEIRNFHSLAYWTQMLENRHFVRISKESHVLPGDPTENAMALFVKEPQDIGELRTAISYRKDCTRTKDSTRATWIEWGNVRYAKQYAEFIQKHHSYAFDFVGHLTQHWLFFLHYLRESRKDKIPLKQILLSDNFAMNLFILIAATFQGLSGLLFSLPARLIARLQDGPRWRSDTNLTELEKFDARVEDEYSKYIDHTPFYMFDYLGKISEVWSIVFRSKESLSRRVINVVQALISSLGLVIKAAISAPIRAIYTSEANLEPDTIKVLIFDPADELDNAVIRRWEKEKDPVYHAHHKIEVVHSTPDHFKLVSIPRYRPFTTICGYLSETFNLEVLEIGSQTEISADVILHPAEATASFPDARLVYELPKLQDEQNRRFATYHFKVPALKALFQSHAVIEYIHE